MIEVLHLTRIATRFTAGPLSLFVAGPNYVASWRDKPFASGVFVSPIDWAKSIAWRAGIRPHWVKWIR